MSSLIWKEVPVVAPSSPASPWFIIAMGLTGFIIASVLLPLLPARMRVAAEQPPPLAGAAPSVGGCGCGGGCARANLNPLP